MEQPVALIVRFATSLADVSLTIPSPSTTAVANVKRQIRTHLPEEERRHGLRLIYSGRVLEGQQSITTALNLPSKPPLQSKSSQDFLSGKDETSGTNITKGKGKQRAPPTDSAPIYIHCAISSFALSPTELAEELEPPVAAAAAASTKRDGLSPGKRSSQDASRAPSTAPQGRGFDRLLQSPGFTRADVAELRAQHTAIISNRYTPDNMPGQEALYDMEEAWLDGGVAGAGAATAGSASMTAAAPGVGDDEDEQRRVLADTLYGAMMGFFWPVGALTWGFREEGIWSKRRKEMVLMGLLLNMTFGIMSLLSL